MSGTGNGNTRLATWQKQAGLSNRALAVLLSDAAEQAGVQLSPNPTQVAAWLGGQQPRVQTAILIAAVLSAQCRRELTLHDLGFTAAAGLDAGGPAPSRKAALTGLAHAGLFAQGRLDMDRRTLIKAGFATSAFMSSAMEWLLPDLAATAHAATTDGAMVGASDADKLWAKTRNLLIQDNKQGGRPVRHKAVALLNNTALPLLAGSFATDEARRKVSAAVAYAGHLAAWTMLDCGDLVAAQKLLVESLAEAKRAGDPIVAAGIMTDMAHAEHLAGDAAHGALIARTAQTIGPGRLPAAILARAAAMQARCEAKRGNLAEARAAIGRAEQYLETGQHSGERHPLDFFFDYPQLQFELHVAYRDLVTTGKTSPDSLLEHERLIGAASHMGRRSAILNADAAIAHLVAGDLDEGTKRADAAIAAAAPLKWGSGRVLGGLQRIRPHLVAYTPSSSAARDLDERLRKAAPWALAV